MLLAAENIEKSYSEKKLLSDISFYLEEKSKTGMIGINGSGKSTLLKILAFAEEPDSGRVTNYGGARIGYLPQNPLFNEELTVMDYILSCRPPQQDAIEIYEAKTVLNRLGIESAQRSIGALSGGQKKRLALAGLLVRPAEILILDEPTNHLDNEMSDWLEQYLIRYTGALVMVTHDRYFLDRIVSRIAEVEEGRLHLYENANYSRYLELKLLRRQQEAGSARKRQALLKQELAWIGRGARARATKSKFRVERVENMLSETAAEPIRSLQLGSLSSRLGKKTVELSGIGKSFGGKTCIKNFDYTVSRRDRIGLVGKNGCGKSTFLNILSGRLRPDSGLVVWGDTVKIGYFSQEWAEMDPFLRVIDYIREFGEYIVTPDGTVSAAQMLEQFLFPSDLQWNRIEKLSGGEKRRLFLLGILMGAPNMLLLDEPTNDLDIETLMILEDYLQKFAGPVLVASHDRYFLDKTVEHIFAFEPGGAIEKYTGGYSDYLKARRETPEVKAPEKTASKTFPSRIQPPGLIAPRQTKFTFRQQREYDGIGGEISLLEEKLARTEAAMTAEACNYQKLEELVAEKNSLEKQLDEKMERWLQLAELAEQIEENKK